MAGQQPMSVQSNEMNGQKLHLPVMLTGQSHSHSWKKKTAKSLPVNLRFCLFVKIQSHSQIEN